VVLRTLAALTGSLVCAPALAQDAVKLEVVRHGQAGQASPALVLVGGEALDYTVNLRCGAAQVQTQGALRPGERARFDLATGLGRHRCAGQLSIRLPDGSTGEMPLSFEVEELPPLKVTVDRADVDLARGALAARADRPLASVEVELYDADGQRIGAGVGRAPSPTTGPVRVELAPATSEVVRVHVKATDAQGFWGGVDLFPWAYEVPHEDVVFESGKALVRPEEEGKLRAALAEVQQVVARYGKWAPVQLYVGGYTDTVGGADTNRALSEARAKAIAGWFKAQGFPGVIHYQGFGEGGLAVATPDETDEARNRRAVYVVAAEAPPPGPAMPGAAWRKL